MKGFFVVPLVTWRPGGNEPISNLHEVFSGMIQQLVPLQQLENERKKQIIVSLTNVSTLHFNHKSQGLHLKWWTELFFSLFNNIILWLTFRARQHDVSLLLPTRFPFGISKNKLKKLSGSSLKCSLKYPQKINCISYNFTKATSNHFSYVEKYFVRWCFWDFLSILAIFKTFLHYKLGEKS